MRRILKLMVMTSCMLLYFSCQKEIHDPTQKQTCKIVSAYYYTGLGNMYDSSQFSYSGDKVIKAESDQKLITYSYNGSNISSRTYFDKWANAPAFSDTTQYDATNRMNTLTVWLYPGRFSVNTTKIVYAFSYKNTRIENITTTRVQFSPGPSSDTLQNIFRVNTAGNTESIVTVDNLGNVYDSVHYVYDKLPNYFTRIHPNYFLFDVNFQLQGSYLHHLPYFFSTNNVIEFSYYVTNTYQVSYVVDSLKNLSSVSVSGSPYVTYKYECQN